MPNNVLYKKNSVIGAILELLFKLIKLYSKHNYKSTFRKFVIIVVVN